MRSNWCWAVKSAWDVLAAAEEPWYAVDREVKDGEASSIADDATAEESVRDGDGSC